MSDWSVLKLDYETPHFLLSLYAGNEKNLRILEEKLNIQVITRDGWISFKGAEEKSLTAQRLFEDLEKVIRGGSSISDQEFHKALDLVCSQSTNSLTHLSSIQLLANAGKKTVVAKSARQLDYIKSMQMNDIVFGLGPAGTGKTYLAVAMALTKLKNKEINKVILTRPAVEAGEALGFLPGDLQEKISPYLRPLYDAISDMLLPSDAQKWMEDGTIEIAPLAYMRGRTLSRACVILDEAQNTTCEQMFMFLTRLGDGGQYFITGDTSQIDLKGGVPSGLVEAEKALQGTRGIAFTKFEAEDVVRHPVVQRIINAYQHHRSS